VGGSSETARRSVCSSSSGRRWRWSSWHLVASG